MEPAPGIGPMVALTRLTGFVYRRSRDGLGVTLKEYMALKCLRDGGTMPQQELGQTMMCDANTLVLILNELEAHGFAVRRRDPLDRRRHIVEITAAGRKALERAEARIESVEQEILAALSDEEQAELGRLLNKALAGQDLPAEAQISAAGQISR